LPRSGTSDATEESDDLDKRLIPYILSRVMYGIALAQCKNVREDMGSSNGR